MTEDKAKMKWCPELAKAVASRGHDPFGEDAYCMASNCMMWVPERRNIEGTMTIVNGGYCGLAK